MKLSEDLKYWRIERPDEWKMDEFIRGSVELEDKSYGYLRYDDSGHEYVIPESLIQEFDNTVEMLDGMSYNEIFGEDSPLSEYKDLWESREGFNKYKVEFDLTRMKITMEED